ncbi:hypothetical protein [Streptomyces flaveolus]|uniref:hypothetical protein n=1 Tax=Streptomyces flaveolus TaxID=67297 RepID=UPI00379556B9
MTTASVGRLSGWIAGGPEPFQADDPGDLVLGQWRVDDSLHGATLSWSVVFDVFEDGRSESHLAGEVGYQWMLGDHRLEVTDPVLEPGAGGAGENEEDAGKDRVPAEPGRPCRVRPSAADGLGLVLK